MRDCKQVCKIRERSEASLEAHSRSFNPTFLQHGVDWDGRDLAGWVAQRKVNGWRAFWDGCGLYTREGHAFAAPAWFLDGLPAFPLDCELTRGCHGAARVNALWRGPASAWREARIHVFDAPTAAGGICERVAVAAASVAGGRFANAVETWAVTSTAELLAQLAVRIDAGWEGFVVRPAGAAYESGRTRLLQKLKAAALY